MQPEMVDGEDRWTNLARNATLLCGGVVLLSVSLASALDALRTVNHKYLNWFPSLHVIRNEDGSLDSEWSPILLSAVTGILGVVLFTIPVIRFLACRRQSQKVSEVQCEELSDNLYLPPRV